MDKKLKILCLHGYRQDATKLRQQTGALRKILKSVVEMDFVSAPFGVPGEGESSRCWWFTQSDSFSSRDAPDECRGLENSVKVVEDAWRDLGPFDGLLGFSQGACLVSLLSSMCREGQTTLTPRFVIIISGFKSKCTAHQIHYQDKIRLPSLHVMGENDEVIPVSWSEDLASVFVESDVLRHTGGHFVPGKSNLKTKYISFLQKHSLYDPLIS